MLRQAVYIAIGIVLLTMGMQESIHAAEMKKLVPSQLRSNDKGMAVETFNGKFIDLSTTTDLKNKYGNLKVLNKNGEIKLKNGNTISQGDIRFLYVKRKKSFFGFGRKKNNEVGKVPFDEE